MMEYSVQRQSGSIVVYIIVGVLLAAAAVGAIIVAQNRGGQEIASRPITEAPQGSTGPASDSTDDKTAEQKQEDQAKKEAAEKKAAEEKAKTEAEAKKKAEADAAQKQAAEQQVAAQSASTTGPMARTGGAPVASDLPTTGPIEDTLSVVIGSIAIMGAGYFYYHFGRRT